MKPDLTPITVQTIAYDDQEPGTSGLRKKTKVFIENPHYLENFIQSTFDMLTQNLFEGNADAFKDKTLVVGGDGRFHNSVAIQTIIKMAFANGFGKIMVAKNGHLSTPAASAVIRKNKALGGFILSASHNPGGINGDFGIKFNPAAGGPAPQSMTSKIYELTKSITTYLTMDFPDVDLSQLGTFTVNGQSVEVFDPLTDYTELMQKIFDFDAIRTLFSGVFDFKYDALNAVTGPYAKHIFCDLLGAPETSILHGTPLEDFGGKHPDPNLIYAKELVDLMYGKDAPDFGAASDGDGDRNMILGRGTFVSPGDSLAILVNNAANYIPGYRRGISGVARSMPTSAAVDLVAKAHGISCYETPTGWKFFVNLMDAGKCQICGEESFGTGSDHVREKDGIWAVLAWLNIIAKSGKSVETLVTEHWNRFGRNYYQRHDFEGLDTAKAKKMLDDARKGLSQLKGQTFAGSRVVMADDFSYKDPTNGEVANNQGLRIKLEDGSRVICRLSGTGTGGATLRVYHDVYRKDWREDPYKVLVPLNQTILSYLNIASYCGVDKPTVIT